MKKKLFPLIIILLLLSTLFTGCIEENSLNISQIIYVDDDGGAEFLQIQKAIDNASDGDTIYILNGTYKEMLILNKSLNLIGAGRNNTVIEWQNIGENSQKNIVCINADNCKIKELKIIGGGDNSDIIGINIKSSYNTIEDNIILDNLKGININRDEKNNYIFRNFISNSSYGIVLNSSSNNNISNNNISSNVLDGIYLNSANENIVFENILSGNNFNGIQIKGSQYNTVFGNLIVSNQIGVLCCCGAANNIVYYNSFIKNTKWNARDPMYNQWDNSKYGNFWDDYNGKDANNDGIGDFPYIIVGNISQDRYPLKNPVDI